MKLKNNKGYVAIDASIAVLILLIIIPTIAGMIININKTNSSIDRKTEAISMAINTIEALKGIGIEGINDESFNHTTVTGELPYTLSTDATPTKTDISETLTKITGIIIEKDNNTYQIEIDIENYTDSIAGVINRVKTLTVKVQYRLGKETKDIVLSTVID